MLNKLDVKHNKTFTTVLLYLLLFIHIVLSQNGHIVTNYQYNNSVFVCKTLRYVMQLNSHIAHIAGLLL